MYPPYRLDVYMHDNVTYCNFTSSRYVSLRMSILRRTTKILLFTEVKLKNL